MTESFNIQFVSGWQDEVKKQTQKLVMKVAGDIKEDAQSIAPVDTGYLRDHIFVEETPGGAIVGSQAPYSTDVELGTYRMRAQPYMRPAAYKKRS